MTDPNPEVRAGWLARLPPKHAAGLKIGLFGGSFNPAHEGHRLASLIALRRLKLDRVWWLVSPGNPLKSLDELEGLEARIAKARRVAHHPAIDVTGVEAALGTRFTVDVLQTLVRRCPGVHFVWIMGADNLANFPRWQRWTTIARTVPIAVVDRPGSTLRSRQGGAGVYLGRWQRPEQAASRLALAKPPAFAFLHGPRSPQSSTALREALRRGDKDGRPGS
ncbi:nicotinate-nucleotide adenylyltransferase [Lichenifustis flavocetrariae]|uniref:Probable nicotinate-nucleotide adenylyltransferase n=1 Tax=Lichenifustis flavocetrariae TaxID=2949735 RepID=A0AA42CIM1_9HYPH|nr:nicotinate-nucleotide adenylyltransferase [Lichenifustis flavocetrariae]MCW6507021.1 nicotinate-nucleotide adenylyltransferase [Lichenifustis flavocetrariae]